MNYLRVHGWEKFQHYRDRNPPWIKLHARLLDDYRYFQLSSEAKWQLTMFWLLASRHDNEIPDDEQWLRRQIGANGTLAVEELISAGWIERYPS
jgi:hypothetical protein